MGQDNSSITMNPRGSARLMTLIGGILRTLLMALVCIPVVTACASAPTERERSAAMDETDAYYLMQEAFGLPSGEIMRSMPFETATCYDGAEQWIVGCSMRSMSNPVRISGPEGPWAYWQFDFTLEAGPSVDDVTVEQRCYGIIPPWEELQLQYYEVDCSNTNQGL